MGREGETKAEKSTIPLSGGGGGQRMRFLCCSLCPPRLGQERAGAGWERRGEKKNRDFGR